MRIGGWAAAAAMAEAFGKSKPSKTNVSKNRRDTTIIIPPDAKTGSSLEVSVEEF
jgi:hypothetical protein